MGGKAAKTRGTGYEYRIAEWFNNREGWTSKRNILSGASQQFVEAVSKHDVRAWSDSGIFLQVEAKKKGDAKDPDKMIIQKKWIDEIDFYKDELLVFATNRSPHYCLLPLKRFFQILGRTFIPNYTKQQHYKGTKQFTLNRANIDDAIDHRYHLTWRGIEYVAFYLEEFVTLRETADLDDQLSYEDRIKRLVSLEKAIEFEKIYLDDLSYKQKTLLYSKLEELENGQVINPLVHSQAQFWLDDSFILKCPHCEETITRKDVTQAKKNETEGFIDWDRED